MFLKVVRYPGRTVIEYGSFFEQVEFTLYEIVKLYVRMRIAHNICRHGNYDFPITGVSWVSVGIHEIYSRKMAGAILTLDIPVIVATDLCTAPHGQKYHHCPYCCEQCLWYSQGLSRMFSRKRRFREVVLKRLLRENPRRECHCTSLNSFCNAARFVWHYYWR